MEGSGCGVVKVWSSHGGSGQGVKASRLSRGLSVGWVSLESP